MDGRRGRGGRWWWLAGGALLVLALGWWLAGGDGGGETRGARAGVWALDAEAVAAAAGGRWQRTSPRVNVTLAERIGAAVLDMPDDWHLQSWRNADTGAELSQLTLLYDEPARAAALAEGPVTGLLAQHLGLWPETWAGAATPEGADEALRWHAEQGWTAVSLRRGGVIVLLATAGPDAPAPEAFAGPVLADLRAGPPDAALPSATHP